MFPLRDNLVTRQPARLNNLLIVANVGVFLAQLMVGEQVSFLLETFALIPVRILNWQYLVDYRFLPLATLFTSTFLHGSWLHIIGNMLYLHVFGDNIEERLGGAVGYLGFYLLCGLGAGVVHCFFATEPYVPTIGASGAIAGVLGGYLVAYPKARVLTLIPLGPVVPAVQVPALLYLPVWFLLQLVNGLEALGGQAQTTAWWAHIGGFAIGLGLMALWPKPLRQKG